ADAPHPARAERGGDRRAPLRRHRRGIGHRGRRRKGSGRRPYRADRAQSGTLRCAGRARRRAGGAPRRPRSPRPPPPPAHAGGARGGGGGGGGGGGRPAGGAGRGGGASPGGPPARAGRRTLPRQFIVRPVATSLLTAAIVLAGIVAYRLLPVAALPQVDYPTI